MNVDELFEKSRAQLGRDEGNSATVYFDSMNIPTIGIGFNLREGLAPEEIEMIFKYRWEKRLGELLAALPWAGTLDEARLGALLNMAWNLGVPRLLGFKNMLAALAEGKWIEAKNHALNSIWYSQVQARAARIAKQFESGTWQ